MVEIKREFVFRQPTEFIGTEAEMNNIDSSILVPGDKFYTEDANGMLAGYMWNGSKWQIFERYDY